MVVVPALARGQDGQDPAVAGIVRSGVTTLAEQVGERIDREGTVPEQDGGNHEPPYEPEGSSHQQEGEAQREGRQQLVAILVEPAELGILVKVGDESGISRVPCIAEDPADVGVPEATLFR